MGETVVIKDVDKDSFRSLKAEAVRAGLKVGEAASQAFRLWVQQRSMQRVRDFERLKEASEAIDSIRMNLKPEKSWSSAEVIRRWRELRRPLW